ncbi:MbtH family protein [Mesorhizobium sp. CGMCC 1.15528]|uniref:MbtH family protein n=1 Tax=Mesorhizobium zhangyense TaxID=1776730 RepID=A0A7C9R8Z0_9HYPH|nr:MbtH family protein [Mesorhizobium zhangyense]NGN43121.1 MbtH family protein [Mesorhizobium zhangyense]
MTDDLNVNPFDDERHRFLALLNGAGQYSLWPAFAGVPAGWSVVFGPQDREACLAHIASVWTDLSPVAA